MSTKKQNKTQQQEQQQQEEEEKYGSQTSSRRNSQQTNASSRRNSQQASQAGSRRTSTAGSASPRNKDPNKGRHNKIYRTPPTPPPEELRKHEKTFVLDCNACSSISNDYSRANPKLGPVIPPYNSHMDRHVQDYYTFIGVQQTLKKTEQEAPGHSIEGPVMDRFFVNGAGHRYLSRRNQFGAGHSTDTVNGHAQFMQEVKPVVGYNGRFGYRRTTPWLRAEPSPFGTASDSPTH